MTDTNPYVKAANNLLEIRPYFFQGLEQEVSDYLYLAEWLAENAHKEGMYSTLTDSMNEILGVCLDGVDWEIVYDSNWRWGLSVKITNGGSKVPDGIYHTGHSEEYLSRVKLRMLPEDATPHMICQALEDEGLHYDYEDVDTYFEESLIPVLRVNVTPEKYGPDFIIGDVFFWEYYDEDEGTVWDYAPKDDLDAPGARYDKSRRETCDDDGNIGAIYFGYDEPANPIV